MLSWMKSYRWPTAISLSLFIVVQLCCPSCTQNSSEKVYHNGVVASTHYLASQVGVDIMKKGGNAVDAAVAVSFALAVVYPEAGNIGGGGFLVMRRNDGFATSIDFRETAPSKALRDMYLNDKGQVDRDRATIGALSVGVPGSVAGMLYALEKYGSLSREEVLAPAIALADEGFVLDEPVGGAEFERFPASDRIFNKPDGTRHEVGETLVQKDLAQTLRRIAAEGNAGFYEGVVAQAIVDTMHRYGGIIDLEDLKAYRPIERAPIEGTYKGYGIVSMAPPSSGGVCLISLLNMLSQQDLGGMGWNTTATIHAMVEAERRTYADRAQYLGDMDFVCVPLQRLIQEEYAQERFASFDPNRATPSSEVSYGEIDKKYFECPQTTHYSIVDKDGTCVSVTTTLNGRFGSYLVADGAGFLLNNEMDDFSAKPGEPNMYGLLGAEANAIEPGKRMLSSMTPSIVTKAGKNFMVIGSPGGSTIITTVLQCILNVVEHGMGIQEAIAAPRFHHQWYPDTIQYEADREPFGAMTRHALITLGHRLRPREDIGVAQGVLLDPKTGTMRGGSDPRCPSSGVAGY